MFATHLIVLLTVKYLSLNVKQYAQNLFVIGNAQNLFVLNQNVSLSVKTQLVGHKLNVVNVMNSQKEFNRLCSLNNMRKIINVVNAMGI